MKWEDKLLGRKFTVVTDHKGLEYFKTQPNLSPRQTRWWEYLSRFNYDTIHINGTRNQVADSLSRYYEYDTIEDKYPDSEFVKADELLDPDGDYAPVKRFVEIRNNAIRRSQRLQEKTPAAITESNALNKRTTEPLEQQVVEDDDPIAYQSANDGKSLSTVIEKMFDLNKIVTKFYPKDKTYSKILEDPKAYPKFGIRDGLIFTKNNLARDVVCISQKATHKGQRLVEIIIDHAHTIIGHYGQLKTAQYIRRFFWWPSMSHDIEEYCRSCGICATTKDANSKPAGLLHNLPIPDRPWQSIGMDFMGPLPKSDNFDYLLVVIDRLTSQVHLVPTMTTVTAKGVAWLIIKEVVRLHGIPESIVSDRDTRFTSIFWKELHRLMGSKLLMSTAFHPQTDGITERANRSIAQILRSVVSNDQKDWSSKCPLVEFAINSSVNTTTGYAPFELNYGYMPRSGQHISTDTQYKGVKQFAQQAVWNLMEAHDAILEHRIAQTHYSNKRRKPGVEYQIGDLVYLSTKNLAMPKHRARKLMPKFIGPYKVLKSMNDTSNITIELPEEFKNRRISPTFHTSLVRPYIENNDALFPKRETKVYYDFGNNEDQEWFVDEILAHKWTKNDLEFQIKWTLGDVTWEPLDSCKNLEALDRYLELRGVATPRDLSRREQAMIRITNQ